MPSIRGRSLRSSDPLREGFRGRMGRARSELAVRDRDVPALRRDAVQLDGQPASQWVRHRFDAALNPLPGGIVGTGVPAGEGGMGVHMPNLPYAAPGIPKGRVYRPRPGEADRHRRSAGRGTTPSRPATCGTRVPHNTAAFRCTRTSTSNSHLWIGNGLRRTALKSRLQKGGANAVPNGCRSWAILRPAGYPNPRQPTIRRAIFPSIPSP